MNHFYAYTSGEFSMKKLQYIWRVCMFILVATCTASAFHVPSKERGDPNYRRKTNIDGNQVRATIFNFAFTGRTGGPVDEVPFEWPKNTKRNYIALNAIFLGGEVKDDAGNTIHIVDVPNYRQNPSGASWNLEPVGGYFNQHTNKLAKSDDASSWPQEWPDKAADAADPGWKGKWNGYFGKNKFNADQEIFYKASDNRYTRYNYTPDSTDVTRRGMGLIIDSRVMEWSQILVNDVVYIIYNVQNDGTKDVDKFATCIWLADLVGGDGDSGDDHAYFDLRNSVAWSTDNDGRGNSAFGSAVVGVAATTYLETPGNAFDRIDNDGDGESGGPEVTSEMLQGESSATNGIDDNGNGLVDENIAYVSFGAAAFRQKPVTFADGVDNNGNGEGSSPTITAQMLTDATADRWHRWPPDPEHDAMQQGLNGRPIVWLTGLVAGDLNKSYKDNIDNNGDCTDSLPRITQAMIDQASADKYHRYRVPGSDVILYELGPEDLGKKYLDKDGLRSAKIDDGIDEMIDESRDDGVDNNNDWSALYDDLGLDGVEDTHDVGEGDGKPTTGALTGFPGEQHIDKTDIKESDQIGLTRVQYTAAGGIDFNTKSDLGFWAEYLIPVTNVAEFYDQSIRLVGDYDLFVSSGLFPLKSGRTERVSTCVVIGQDTSDALRHRYYAQQTYNENYQFAKAPLQPTLTAVAGNHQVTLYWDNISEKSTDSYLESLGALHKGESNFEGYKIYRSTDPAFLDALRVTDASGNLVYDLPVASFDLVDGIKGIDSIGVNGAHYNFGDDTGIKHSWIDNDVMNGRTYYYAIRAFSKGAERYGIGPAESILPISLEGDGTLKFGQSVQIVVPNAPAAGYVGSTLGNIKLVQGSSTGQVAYDVVDPTKTVDGRKYRITFEDTTIHASAGDTLTSKVFTLAALDNPSAPETLISRSKNFSSTYEQPLIDGFRLRFFNESFIQMNATASHWSRSGIMPLQLDLFRIGSLRGVRKPSNYRIEFGPIGFDTTVALRIPGRTYPAKPVNFRVFNVSEGKRIRSSIIDIDTSGGPGFFSANHSEQDWIVFREATPTDSVAITWRFNLDYDSTLAFPVAGDTATIVVNQPFLRGDIFEFTAAKQHINSGSGNSVLDSIRVVPNPFVVSAVWDTRSPYSSGIAPHEIHFNHLPSKCTISIFTVNGELVRTIDHDSPLLNGTDKWDLLTRDNLPAAYGLYLYHVNAPGFGEKVGKFAIIK